MRTFLCLLFLLVSSFASAQIYPWNPICVADFNQDGDIDEIDLMFIQDDFGRCQFNRPCTVVDPCHGDFTHDGDVDGSDMAYFNKCWQEDVGDCPICWIPPCPPNPFNIFQ